MRSSRSIAVAATAAPLSFGADGTAFAAGKAEVEAPEGYWDAYVAELEQIRIYRYLALVQSTYDRDCQ